MPSALATLQELRAALDAGELSARENLAFDLRLRHELSDADIDQAMSGVICRCGTYPRIRKGIIRAARAINAPEQEQENDG